MLIAKRKENLACTLILMIKYILSKQSESVNIYMGEISQGVQSLNLMSYLWGVLRPFFGDLGLCYGKN